MNIKKYLPTFLAIVGGGISMVGGLMSNKNNQEQQIEAAREQAAKVAREETRRYRIEQKEDNEEKGS